MTQSESEEFGMLVAILTIVSMMLLMMMLLPVYVWYVNDKYKRKHRRLKQETTANAHRNQIQTLRREMQTMQTVQPSVKKDR